MKDLVDINTLKRDLKQLKNKMNSKTYLFIVIGIVITLLSIVLLLFKIKNRVELLCYNDDFYYDEDDFYEDYHALDYEDENENEN